MDRMKDAAALDDLPNDFSLCPEKTTVQAEINRNTEGTRIRIINNK
jgi:hypothetical protein